MTTGAGPLVECVPNVSEGRRQAVIERLAQAVRDVPGACLMDVHSDPDHNRSVYTFAGAPAAAGAAARAMAAVAVELIDLRSHSGVHPRTGAIDVIPFVPLAGTDMDLCVSLARDVARDVAAELELPAFLYGQVNGRRLAELRRSGAVDLTAGTPLSLAPDFGPRVPHPTAGVVAVGARPVLIAFNLVLDTADVAVAAQIAVKVRESSGGLPAVQAMGLPLPLRGLAQVSMNLLDHRRTSLAAVVREVVRLAAASGAPVREAELVGLVPAEALAGLEAAAGGTLPGLPDESQSIEARLAGCSW